MVWNLLNISEYLSRRHWKLEDCSLWDREHCICLYWKERAPWNTLGFSSLNTTTELRSLRILRGLRLGGQLYHSGWGGSQ